MCRRSDESERDVVMGRSLTPSVGSRQPIPVERPDPTRSTAVEHALSLLRRAIADCGWTFDALEAHTGKDRSYLSAIFSGDRPCRLDFLVSLPEDVRRRYSELVAEHNGWIVVRPLTGIEAQKAYVAGALGLLKPTMAKASLGAELKSEVA